MENILDQVEWIVEELPDGGIKYTHPNPPEPNVIESPIPDDLIDLPQEQIDYLALEAQKNLVREKRNDLLLKSDWTQGADSILSAEKKAEWAHYRQLLRDLTKNISTVDEALSIVWPDQPK